MRFDRVLIVSLLILSAVSGFSAALRQKGAFVGGYTPIKDLNDPHVKEIANFAVSEYDKQSGAKLRLVKIVSGDSQVVAGTNYRLVIAAKGGSRSAAASNYEALVYERSWEHFRNLTSFKPVH